MGVFSGWQSAASSAAQIVANLAGQTVSMLKLTLTQVTGEIALQMTNGARLKLGTGTTDYFESDGSTRITAAGILAAAGSMEVPTSGALYLDGSTRTIGVLQDGTTVKVLGALALTPNTDQAINLGSTGVRWSNAYFGGDVQIGAGSGTATPIAVGRLTTSTTAVGNVGAGEDDLISYSMPASTLTVNNRGVRVTAWGSAANTAAAKTVKLYFGATATVTTALTANQVGAWRIVSEVIRTGAATQDAVAQLIQGGATTLVDAEFTTPTETLSGAVVIKCTATATNNDDIIQEGLVVESL